MHNDVHFLHNNRVNRCHVRTCMSYNNVSDIVVRYRQPFDAKMGNYNRTRRKKTHRQTSVIVNQSDQCKITFKNSLSFCWLILNVRKKNQQLNKWCKINNNNHINGECKKNYKESQYAKSLNWTLIRMKNETIINFNLLLFENTLYTNRAIEREWMNGKINKYSWFDENEETHRGK